MRNLRCHIMALFVLTFNYVLLLLYTSQGRKGGRILNDDSSSDVIDSMSSLWTSELASSITSVYFDSPTMSMYTERLKRSQGSQLFRIRWYGEKKPTKDEKVFLELKTHNESWIGDSSVKERVAIRDDDVYKLLDTKSGRYVQLNLSSLERVEFSCTCLTSFHSANTVTFIFNSLQCSWDEQFASDLVRAANPDEDFQSITELSKLLLKIRTTAVKFNLTPCVRTKYTRAALQSSSNNHCRLTIDRDIMVINERGESKNSSSSSWCLDDTASVSEKDVVKLPYCVYEVKIANDNKAPPQFITDLEGCNAIVEAKKFSKFLSGVSIHNADKVATLPWWAADAKFSPLYQEETDISCSDRTANTCFIDGSNRTDVPFSVESAIKTSSTSLSTNPSKLKDIEEGKPVDTEPSDMADLKSRRKSSRKSLVRRISSITVPIYKQNGTFEKRVAPKTRLRVEPKSHFANERTFIQWVSAALLFITFSQLFNIMASQSDNQEARIAGTWMLAMALFISVYALATYYRRVYLMRHGKPYGYIDWIGPGILTASIVSGVILLTVYTNQSQEKASVSTMVPEAGKCVRRSLEGPPSSSQISLLLELQPSGVVVDETRQMILVPTTNKIIALKDGLPDEEESKKPVEVVATLPGTDIEALELVEGKIFALSEGKHESEIIALEFGEGNQLKEIQRWKLSSLSGVEGLALVPGKHKQDPSELILAGADDSKLSVYDIDSFNDNVDSVESKTMLNSKFVANGLPDMKISDMHFFEGLLYMLFDNSRVIRAIDTNTGTIVQDIPLPVAEVGSKKQWEGMRLQRINEDSAGSGGVRGSGPASTLVLHLALDTPAQVWSLRLDETVVGQRWSLPSCAL